MAQHASTHDFVPALGYHWLTRLYDPLLAVTMRERALKAQLVRQAELRAGQVVLDFGCGSGTLAMLLKQSCPAARVIGLDPDPKILSLARRKVAAAGLDIELRQGFLTADTFAPASLDRVVTSLVLHHLTHVERDGVLAIFRRILRPDGELHIADFGAPRGRYARFISHFFQHFDGAERTADNLGGRLAAQIAAAGFADVGVLAHRGTPFGTVEYLRAVAPSAA
jgi:SAM-dependent methyltransferase